MRSTAPAFSVPSRASGRANGPGLQRRSAFLSAACFRSSHRSQDPAVGTAAGSPTIATVTILAFLIFVVWRLVEALHSQQITVHLWHPHRATLLIAVTFVVTLLTVGAWAYTDALAAIAQPAPGAAVAGVPRWSRPCWRRHPRRRTCRQAQIRSAESRHGPALHCRRDDDGNWRETGAGQQRRTYPAWLTWLAATCLGSRRIDGAVDRRCNRNFTRSTAMGVCIRTSPKIARSRRVSMIDLRLRSMGTTPMEMQQIRYFVALAQTLNFTRAAEQCNVSQPALTRAIQQLEHELGGPLFHRERNNTHLSELGRMMAP